MYLINEYSRSLNNAMSWASDRPTFAIAETSRPDYFGLSLPKLPTRTNPNADFKNQKSVLFKENAKKQLYTKLKLRSIKDSVVQGSQ